MIVPCDAHGGPLVLSALKPCASRMIAAVYLHMTILAGAARQTLTGRTARQLTRCRRLIGAEKLPGMSGRQVMTLLAKVRTCCHQKLVVIGAMHGMAVGAILAHRCVLPQKRPALFGMAGVANDIGTFRLQQWLGGAAMRIVAVDARHPAFRQWHVRSLVEFGALLRMAARTGIVDATLGQQTADRIFFHGVVAVRATELAVRVNGTRPMQLAAAFMARHALTVLCLNGSAPAFGKADQE